LKRKERKIEVNSRGRPPPSPPGPDGGSPLLSSSPTTATSNTGDRDDSSAPALDSSPPRSGSEVAMGARCGARENESGRGAARFKRKARPFPCKGASFPLRLVYTLRCCRCRCLIGQSSSQARRRRLGVIGRRQANCSFVRSCVCGDW
jgi:hypothetical protein